MPRLLSNRYELGSLIGAGGSARVYEARDVLLDRMVAVKLLDDAAAASNDPAGRDRFLREAQALARFAHPHAVAVYDAGDVDGDLFIVMELVEGTSLAHLIATTAPMAETDVTRIGTQLLDALDAAHSAGLVHRDVKPANVLIDASGDVKLADFGIAKRFDDLAESLTTVGTVIGTPQYLAPEQAAGDAATPQSDVYSTGVVLYEMLIGTRPLVGSSGASAGPDVRESRPEVSPTLAHAVARSLADRPGDRFATAAEMASTLRVELPATALLSVQPTQILSQGSADNSSTRVIPPDDSTAVWPASPAPTSADEVQPVRSPTQARHRWWVTVAPAILVLFALVGFALWGSATNTTTSALTSIVQSTTANQATSIVQSTSSVAETTAATPSPPVDLIPGFPATDDLQQFVDQLRAGRDVVGKQSKKLGDSLQRVLDKDPAGRGSEADKAVTQLREWVDKGEIDPIIADAVYVLLNDLGLGPYPMTDGSAAP